MRRISCKAATRILIASGAGLVLTVLVMTASTAATQLAQANAQARMIVVPSGGTLPLAIPRPWERQTGRVQSDSCAQPENPSIQWSTADGESPQPGETITFEGIVTVSGGSGVLTFTWNLGDGSESVYGQVVKHIYSHNGTYTVNMTVSSSPCPPTVTEVAATTTISVGTGMPDIYLPLIMKD
jgi:hypothetical protein